MSAHEDPRMTAHIESLKREAAALPKVPAGASYDEIRRLFGGQSPRWFTFAEEPPRPPGAWSCPWWLSLPAETRAWLTEQWQLAGGRVVTEPPAEVAGSRVPVWVVTEPPGGPRWSWVALSAGWCVLVWLARMLGRVLA